MLYRKLGHVGKEKMRKLRIFSFTLLLTACGANQPISFAGQIVPQAGVCDAAAPAVLTRRGHYVQFAPQEGTLVLSGQIAPDGAVRASLDTPGADRKPYHLFFEGTLTGKSLAGRYVTPRCRYTVTLQRDD
jgi:hypothetical protein